MTHVTDMPTKRPLFLLLLLSVTLIFLSIGGVYGGYMLLNDTTGMALGLSLGYLQRTPFSDYQLPALFLMFGYGFGGLVIVYGLWSRAPLPWVENLTRFTGAHWAWDWSVLLGSALVVWLTYQLIALPNVAPVQLVMYGVAALLIGLPLIPTMRAYYRDTPS